VPDSNISVAFDMTFPNRNQAGSGAYARSLVAALKARADIETSVVSAPDGTNFAGTIRWLLRDAGETLSTIAAKYGVTVAQIRWSNTNLYSNDSVATGDQIVIPPIPGVVVTIKASDTVDALATKYQVDPQTIIDFNRLRSSDLVTGTDIVIPNGVGGAFPPPPALWQLLQQHSAGSGSGYLVKVLGCCLGPYTNNGFPAGWCTYYVATKRQVTWRGDAGYWYQNASAQGYAVGPTPKVGAIMVTWESWAGHVAYVEAVNPDGSWMVTEMNWVAFDVINQRTIKPGQLGQRLVGFIY